MGGGQSHEPPKSPTPPPSPPKAPRQHHTLTPATAATTQREAQTQSSTTTAHNTAPSQHTRPYRTPVTQVQYTYSSTGTIHTSASTSTSQSTPQKARPASQDVKHLANNYLIPEARSKERNDSWAIRDRWDRTLLRNPLRVCPQHNGQGCVAEPCRRLHVCYFWATKNCKKASCTNDHSISSPHNMRIVEALGVQPYLNKLRLDDALTPPSSQEEEEQICIYSVLRKCTKNPCSKVHSAKNYMWEVRDRSGWIQLSYSQSDYLELMYGCPSEECVDLIPLQTHVAKNRNLRQLSNLLSRETSWSVDLEAFKLRGASSIHSIRRLSTPSDLISSMPAATRWLWYWEDDGGGWEPYGEGHDRRHYYVALGDHLEHTFRVKNKSYTTLFVGEHSYSVDGKEMTQTNRMTNKIRRIRRRPACSLVRRSSVRFDELFLTRPATKRFLKIPVVRLSSEFLFVENLMRQTLTRPKITSIHRIQNDHLWKVYQNKKRLLTSLYGGDVRATNEQYLFHGTRHDAVDHICADNLDWKLWGTNVGHAYGQGTYFSNLAKLAHCYGKSDASGKKVMLVVLVLVGKLTLGNGGMNLPPLNESAGRHYDTTCNSETGPSIFVKYDRDEYYPAYVVTYGC